MSTQNNTPDTTNINITFEKDGTLNYSFSPSLTLAEVIGSFVIVGYGLLNNNSNSTAMLRTLYEQATAISTTIAAPDVQYEVEHPTQSPIFHSLEGLLSDFKAKS